MDKNMDIDEFKESKELPGQLGLIKLNDNTKFEVDICLIAIGGRPSTSFVKNTDLKLTLDNYIIVDKHMKTNLEHVYAAGDCVYFPRECLSGFEFTLSKYAKKLDHVNIAHWGVASSHGKVAANSIINLYDQSHNRINSGRSIAEKLPAIQPRCGSAPKANTERASSSSATALPMKIAVNSTSSSNIASSSPLDIVPFFWTVQCGKSIRFAGYIEQYEKVVFHEDKTKQNEFKFVAFYILEDLVVGCCSMDWDPVCAVFAELMFNKINVSVDHVANDPLDIKKLLV
jgi:hypothetical protein